MKNLDSSLQKDIKDSWFSTYFLLDNHIVDVLNEISPVELTTNWWSLRWNSYLSSWLKVKDDDNQSYEDFQYTYLIFSLAEKLEKILNVPIKPSYYSWRNNYYSLSLDFKSEPTIEELISTFYSINKEKTSKIVTNAQKHLFDEAKVTYQFLTEEPQNEKIHIEACIEMIHSKIKLSWYKYSDLAPWIDDEDMILNLYRLRRNNYIKWARGSFEYLKTKFPEHRDESPQDNLLFCIEELWWDFSYLDEDNIKTHKEMEYEYEKALSLWLARRVFCQVNWWQVSMFTNNMVETLDHCSYLINWHLIAARENYSALDHSWAKSHEEMVEITAKIFEAVKRWVIKSSMKSARRDIEKLKTNISKNPHKLLEEIKKSLLRWWFHYDEVDQEVKEEIDTFIQLSKLRALGLSLYDDQTSSKDIIFQTIKSKLLEIWKDFSDLDVVYGNSSEEIEKQLYEQAHQTKMIWGDSI